MPKPEPRPLRTLPERAFHARARLVAALMCCVCFAGLAARLAYLQLFQATGMRAVPSASNCAILWCLPTGAVSTAPTVYCLPPTAAAGHCGPPRARCRRKSSALPRKALRKYWSWTKRSCWKNSVTAPPTTAFCATAWSATPPTACGIFVKRTASPASASIRTPSAGTRRGNFWPACWALPM